MTEATKRRKPPITKWFSSWLSARDTAATFGDQQDKLRGDLLDALIEFGEEDDAGHLYYDLPKPVPFTDREGKTHVYTTLKRERHLRPAQPVPDAEKALELLQKKGLWLTAKQLKAIADLQVACPFAVISLGLDPDAVAKAYYQDEISEEEYESILGEQKEVFQFRPSE